MTTIDPVAWRELLDGPTGSGWMLARSFEHVRSVGGLASSADAYLNEAIRCILVGYGDQAQALLQRAFEWLTAAICDDERPRVYAPGGTESQRHLNLALCNWLLKGEHDAENFAGFVRYREQFLDGSKLATNKSEIGLTLPSYVDAGAYREALVRFFRAGFVPPESLALARGEGHLSYIYCRHRLGEEYDAQEVDAVTKSFLNRQLNSWLASGHFLRAAEWLKISYWLGDESQSSAWSTVLRCSNFVTALDRCYGDTALS